MALAPIFYVVQSPGSGAAISGATVTVNQHPSGSPAVLYSDEAGSSQLPSPVNQYTTDTSGRATYGGQQVWVASGRYDLTISGPTLTSTTLTRDFFSTNHIDDDEKSFTVGDQDGVDAGATSLGEWTVSCAPQQTKTLIGVYHRAITPSGSEFAVETDHGSHGTFSPVAGLDAIVPASGAAILASPTGGPLALVSGDTVRMAVVTVGATLGYELSVIIRKSFV